MYGRKSMKLVSLFVLLTFVGGLGTPVIEAAEAAQAARTAAAAKGGGAVGAVNAAKNSLQKLWFAWTKGPGAAPAPAAARAASSAAAQRPTPSQAFKWFLNKGATPKQAEVLANNAVAQGQTTGKLLSVVKAPANFIKSLFGKKPVAPAAAARSTQQASSSQASQAAAKPGILTAAKEKIAGFFSGIRQGAKKVAQKVHRGAHKVNEGVTTAALTAKDGLSFHRYYELPLSDTTAVKFRGQWQSVTKFTKNGWVVGETTFSSKFPNASMNGELAAGRAEQIMVGAQEGKIVQGKLGKMAGKIQDSARNFLRKITGKGKIGAAETQQLSKLEIQGRMLEQSRAIVDAQRAIDARIAKLTKEAAHLGKEPPAARIAELKQGYKTLEAQKQELARRLDQAGKSPAKNVVGDAARWALYSVGITAGINLIRQVWNGEDISLTRAFSFIKEPSFWGGTVGGFAGSMLLTTLASSFMPPGAGLFFKVLPGFLGAALGFEMGSGIFGGGPTNWVATIGQTIASAGGYTLAATFVGGTFVPIIGAIAAGAVANLVMSKLFKGPTAEAAGPLDLPAPTAPVAPLAANATSDDEAGIPTLAVVKGPQEPKTTPGLSTSAAMSEMRSAYNEYINLLKERKVNDARRAYDRYVKAKEALDKNRQAAQ